LAAIVNVCVDPRLDHAVIRSQVEARLERMRLPKERVFITNDVGGNVGSAAKGTVDLLVKNREEIVLAAVLHHGDCAAAAAGLRQPIEASVERLRRLLGEAGIRCPVLSGTLRTETSAIAWSDEPPRSYELLSFRMPRL